MYTALQRRLDRLFPPGNNTIWLDCRQGYLHSTLQYPAAIIGLQHIAVDDKIDLPAKTIVLDMDSGACMEDAIRCGADGVLCSSILPLEQLAALARECRKWNYPLVADCRQAPPEEVRMFYSLGIQAALLEAGQVGRMPFPYYVTNLVLSNPCPFFAQQQAGVRHEH